MQEDIYAESGCQFTGYQRYKHLQQVKFNNAWGYMYVNHDAKTFPLFTYLNYQAPWEYKAFKCNIPEEITDNIEYPPTNFEIFDQHNLLQLMPITSGTISTQFDFWSVHQQRHPISHAYEFNPGMTSEIRNFTPCPRHEHLPTAYLNGLLRAMLWDFHAWWTNVSPKLFTPGFFESYEVRKRLSEALTNKKHAQSRIIFYSPIQHRPKKDSDDSAQVLPSNSYHFNSLINEYHLTSYTKEVKFL